MYLEIERGSAEMEYEILRQQAGRQAAAAAGDARRALLSCQLAGVTAFRRSGGAASNVCSTYQLHPFMFLSSCTPSVSEISWTQDRFPCCIIGTRQRLFDFFEVTIQVNSPKVRDTFLCPLIISLVLISRKGFDAYQQEGI